MSSTVDRLTDLFTTRVREIVPPLFGAAGEPVRPLISLAYGLADPALFPRAELIAAATQVLAYEAAESLNYAMSYPGLTDQIVARLQAEGVDAQPEQVLVGYGSGQILALLPEIFVEPGDIVIIEGPSFLGAVKRFVQSGARLITVPVDEHGMNVTVLADVLRRLAAEGRRPKFIYTIPTFHNPTGVTLSLDRRRQLVALAAEYGVPVVEDDAYIDLRFSGEPLPSLAALDQAGWVIRVGTYSKILAPGLRIGWVHARREIIDRLLMVKAEGTTGPFITRVVARYCADGRLERHITELRRHYAAKCHVMVSAVQRHFPAEAHFVRPEGGFFIWVTLPSGVSAQTLLTAARSRGAEFLPGSACFAEPGQGDNAIRLAFSFQSSERIEQGIAAIGAAFGDL
ncbi:aminotransferase-like domain-containing protein [Chloroflexus aggregans]|uniref:Transcriptional regulator, GntR family n=1 Tax=Chloroflexus aggregans (strain MD-66 / DSM 9485) TaxID=326427 RepID=B8G709_CHLAD|nr:PLP-dependent aminotransferase family protein [Chloroflexus aggregans]ACL23966.1 putative transcriptional regulator, GntR family [Chloroflexus aggregans DSM 9485]